MLGFLFENSTVKSSNTNEEMWIQYYKNIGKQFRWTVLKNNILTTKYRYSSVWHELKGFDEKKLSLYQKSSCIKAHNFVYTGKE